MNTFTKFLVACSVFVLAACDSDNNNNRGGNQPPVEFATVQVFHGVSDAPTVDVIIDGAIAIEFELQTNFIRLNNNLLSIQEQPRTQLLRLRRMALVAVFDEDRTYF